MVEFIELKDIKKQQRKDKLRKFIKTTRKGAGIVGKKVRVGAGVVAKGAGTLIQKAKEAQSPEAQERRLEVQEKKLIVQERLAQRRARIAKLQPKGQFGGIGGGFLGGSGGGFGFKPLDMGNVLSGGPPKKRKGKPFDPLSQI